MKIIDPTVDGRPIPQLTELRIISSSVSGLTILQAWVLWVPQAHHRSSLASDPIWTQKTLTLRSLPNIDQHFAENTVRVVMTNTPIFFLGAWSAMRSNQIEMEHVCANCPLVTENNTTKNCHVRIWRLGTDPKIQRFQLKRWRKKTKSAWSFSSSNIATGPPGFH